MLFATFIITGFIGAFAPRYTNTWWVAKKIHKICFWIYVGLIIMGIVILK